MTEGHSKVKESSNIADETEEAAMKSSEDNVDDSSKESVDVTDSEIPPKDNRFKTKKKSKSV